MGRPATGWPLRPATLLTRRVQSKWREQDARKRRGNAGPTIDNGAGPICHPWLARRKKKVYKFGSGRAITGRGRMRPATEGSYGEGSDGHGDSASTPSRVAAGWGGQDGWATAGILH